MIGTGYARNRADEALAPFGGAMFYEDHGYKGVKMALSANSADSNTVTGVCNGSAVPCATYQLTELPNLPNGGQDWISSLKVAPGCQVRLYNAGGLSQSEGTKTYPTAYQDTVYTKRNLESASFGDKTSSIKVTCDPKAACEQHPELCAKACLGEWWTRYATHSWEYKICDAADMDAVIRSHCGVNSDFTLADPSKSDAEYPAYCRCVRHQPDTNQPAELIAAGMQAPAQLENSSREIAAAWQTGVNVLGRQDPRCWSARCRRGTRLRDDQLLFQGSESCVGFYDCSVSIEDTEVAPAWGGSVEIENSCGGGEQNDGGSGGGGGKLMMFMMLVMSVVVVMLVVTQVTQRRKLAKRRGRRPRRSRGR